MAIKLIIFNTTSSHLEGASACDYDRGGAPLELWHANGFNLNTNSQIQLFTDEALQNVWGFSSSNTEVFSIQKYNGVELHATIEIEPNGKNASAYTECASPVWNLTFEVGGAPVTEVSEGDTVTLLVNVISNAALSGENLSWLLGGSGNAVLADTSLTSGTGNITLDSLAAGSVQLEGDLEFTIVTDNENADETLAFEFSDMSISDGNGGTITIPAPRRGNCSNISKSFTHI